MKKYFLLILFCSLCLTSSAQILDDIFFETSFVTKFSVGEETRKNISYQPGINTNVPKISKFDNRIHGLNLTANYALDDVFSMGIGAGVSFAKMESHPIVSNEYLDKVFIPVFLRFRYQKYYSGNWTFLSEVNGGYQFYKFVYGYSGQGFDFKETGGLLLNFNIGVGKKIDRFTPILKIGYELNQFTHENSLGWIGNSNLDYQDKIKYKTYYHLVKISLSIKI